MTVNASGIRVFPGRNVLLGGIFFLSVLAAAGAQESALEELPGLKERAVVMHIVSRIIEQNQQVVWNSENTRVTIPGRPVGLKLVGDNLVVVVQFTPFLRANGQNILVAQGQIWIKVPDEGISYHTTMQTIPLQFGEHIYFFPLGSADAKDESSIEIQLVVEPYTGVPAGGQQHRGPPPRTPGDAGVPQNPGHQRRPSPPPAPGETQGQSSGPAVPQEQAPSDGASSNTNKAGNDTAP
ncbi:MAG: hypothetical protein FWC45_05335 [Treponema sp.]|nr:hypothetical protein [Treponema sp.]